MQITVNDLKTFYSDLIGRIVRKIIRAYLREIWPSCDTLRVMGFGFAGSYLKPYLEEAERVFTVMPKGMGAYQWPNSDNNRVFLSEEYDLPLETNSIDRILVIHSLEFSDNLHETYAELWRVLKSTGRLIVVVPNRLGFWARAEWTPFGQGTPYTAGQVRNLLKQHNFVHERTKKILYVPPFRNTLFIRSAHAFEAIGQYVCSALCGLHMVEVSKQIYAYTGPGVKQTAKVGQKEAVPAGAASGRLSDIRDDHS